MNFRLVFYLLGKVMMFLALFLLLPCVVALIYKETAGIYFLITAVGCLIFGWLLSMKKPKNMGFYAREGFVVVALSWIMLSLFGAIPFWASGEIPQFIDAIFEMVSGFTTTGATIVPQVESLSNCMLFWRSFSHWIGGMGVLVFMLAILPMAGGNNMHLLRAESSGTTAGKLVPKMKETAIILYAIYAGMTALMIIILACTGMPVFDNVCISIGTAGTGGFGIVGDSIASYTATQQWIITIFMFIFGVNFNFYYLILLKKVGQAFRMEEVRWYVVIYVTAVAIIAINIYNVIGNVPDAIRHSAFQVISLMSTTGYATIDYEVWPQISIMILTAVMFIGGCAGSTAGGIKVSRFVIGAKSASRELKKLIHPQGVKVSKMDGKPLSDGTMKTVTVYFFIYILIFAASALVVALDNFDFETTFTSVSATLNNVGPGFGEVGPTDNFAKFSVLSKVVFIFDMLVGRLEIFPMLLLFMPSTWKNR